MWDRLPDVSGKLFLTFPVDPKLFASEEAAFETSRDWLRKVFFQLRHDVEHEGKTYMINAPYCIKVECYENGWVHYHAIFLTRRFGCVGFVDNFALPVVAQSFCARLAFQ